MSELGEWKDVNGFPNCQISSTGAFMNKRTLNMLKHFRHKDSDEVCVTLYRMWKANILSVKRLLTIHFGEDADLPEVVYRNHKLVKVTIPSQKHKKPNYVTESVDPICTAGVLGEDMI